MIFPLDVNKVVVDSKKLAGENKIQAAIAACILGSFFLFFVLDYVLNTVLGFGLGVTIAVLLVIVGVVGVFVFRFVIFDEDLRKKEFEGAGSDSFARYMWLRSDIGTSTSVKDEKVSVYEYVNGASMCILELRFGSNDDSRAMSTRRLNEKMLEIACSNGLETRVIDVAEDFRNSKEFKEHIALINNLKDKQAAKNVMIINDAIMEESYKQCSVDVLYFMMRTVGNYQKADLENALKKIFIMMQQNASAYRSVHFLEPQELMEFFRAFYGISAIDLSMMRTIELAQQVSDEFQNVVSIMRLQSKTGKVYATQNKIE